MNRRILLIMLNFTKGSMKEKKESPTPEVQQTNIPYCKRYRLNHMALCDLLIKEDMADTESVARLFHMYWNNSRQRIRWGVIYNAALPRDMPAAKKVRQTSPKNRSKESTKFWTIRHKIKASAKAGAF